jgi:hypothetical protein
MENRRVRHCSVISALFFVFFPVLNKAYRLAIAYIGYTEDLLCRVLRDAKGNYSFEMRGLRFEGATLSFYIKPADGAELPDIMQWMMNFVH